VPSRIRLGQRGIDWTKLVVGVARRPGVHEYDSACCDTARGACARSRGIESCHSGNRARPRHAARRSRDVSGPKHHAQAANRRFATWLTLGTDTEPCIQRRRHNGILEQQVVSVHTIEQWRGSSSSRNRTAELDEPGTDLYDVARSSRLASMRPPGGRGKAGKALAGSFLHPEMERQATEVGR
jgi:hypothetical protein